MEAHRSGQGVYEIVLERGLMAKVWLDAVVRPETLTAPDEWKLDAEAPARLPKG